MAEKHLLVMGDNHGGAGTGLTPPQWWDADTLESVKQMWTWYVETLAAIGHLDMAAHLGDSVDGLGSKQSGIEQITTDTSKQAKIAIASLEPVQTDKWVMVFGTPYHTVGSYDFEQPVADAYGACIKDSQYISINSVKFSIRHIVGHSGTPYGQPTMIAKELLRDLVTAVNDEQEPADWVMRGHAHCHCEVGIDGRRARVCPCLQIPDTIYGRRLNTWYYHIGVLEYWIGDDGTVREKAHLMPLNIIRRREWVLV